MLMGAIGFMDITGIAMPGFCAMQLKHQFENSLLMIYVVTA